jgi:hypothetical protein
MVALEGSAEAPRVILRRRLELLEVRQPYHAAAKMRLGEAEEFLAVCRQDAHAAACHALRCALQEIGQKGYVVAGACVLLGSGRNVTDLKTILGSHPLLHTADGVFFREALQSACAACAVAVRGVREKEASATAVKALRLSADELQRRIAELGSLIGPPWTQDQKLSAMAAWIVLADSELRRARQR